MKILILSLVVLHSFPGLATDLRCELADQPGQSELVIKYAEDLPEQLSLRSPGEDEARPQSVMVEVIRQRQPGPSGEESFVARPVVPEDIPWEKIEECYVPIGTLWHFQFSHDRALYQVQMVPEFARENASCVPPRFRPQLRPLDCTYH